MRPIWQTFSRCRFFHAFSLRYAYWLAATVAVRMRDNSFRTKFDRYIGKDPTGGDLKRKALTAVAVKMARVAHSLIKHEVDYRDYREYCIPGDGTSLQNLAEDNFIGDPIIRDPAFNRHLLKIIPA